MSSIIEQIAEVEIQQILALRQEVSAQEAFQLYKRKMALVNQFHEARLLKHADSLIKLNWLERLIIRLLT